MTKKELLIKRYEILKAFWDYPVQTGSVLNIIRVAEATLNGEDLEVS